jgi:hypothetical protein
LPWLNGPSAFNDSFRCALRSTASQVCEVDLAFAGKGADIKGRIESIRQQVEEATSEYDKEKLQELIVKKTPRWS